MRRSTLTLLAGATATAIAVPLIGVGFAGAANEGTTITLSEFKIVMPAKLKAGQSSITVRNTGKFPHDVGVVFKGAGTTFATPVIAPGKSYTLKVNLKPGGYAVACHVGNGFHASQGMVKGFSVGTFDFATGSWKA